MQWLVPALVVVATLLTPISVDVRSSGHSSSSGTHHSSSYCYTCARDSHGRIERSPAAREEFMSETGYPNGRPGYVIDHIIPLKRGGVDAPYNMQWQTRKTLRPRTSGNSGIGFRLSGHLSHSSQNTSQRSQSE